MVFGLLLGLMIHSYFVTIFLAVFVLFFLSISVEKIYDLIYLVRQNRVEVKVLFCLVSLAVSFSLFALLSRKSAWVSLDTVAA